MSGFLHPQTAHNARMPRQVVFTASTESSARSSDAESDGDGESNQFPMKGSAQIAGARRKVPVGPGHSAMDWGRLKSSGFDLRNGITALQRYTPSEVAQHNTKEDMWMAFQGKIYCCTHYLAYHPGGVGQLMRGAGKDATELFMKVHPWVNMDYIMGDKCLVGYLIPEGMKKPTPSSVSSIPSARSPRAQSPSRAPIEFKIPRNSTATTTKPTPKQADPTLTTKVVSKDTQTATLASVQRLSPTITTFTFKLSQPVRYLPGAYAMFDFAPLLALPQHAQRKLLARHARDDFVRTWTLSSAPPVSHEIAGTFVDTCNVSCTVRRDGLLSTFLHEEADQLMRDAVAVPVLDVGGVFTCFRDDGVKPLLAEKILFAAGGVGVTPILAMLEALGRSGFGDGLDVVVLFSVRGEDAVLAETISRNPVVSRLVLFDSKAGERRTSMIESSKVEFNARRVVEADVAGVAELNERECFVCGPLDFMKAVKVWLCGLGVDESRMHDESFAF